MTRDSSGDGGPDSGGSGTEWPVALSGVSETVVTTLGPNDRWNVAALGVHAPDGDGPATATTWGRTRTWRNFRERGGGYVQFTRDPVDFAEAALSVREEDVPVLDSVDAWVEVDVERRDSGSKGDTQWSNGRYTPSTAPSRGGSCRRRTAATPPSSRRPSRPRDLTCQLRQRDAARPSRVLRVRGRNGRRRTRASGFRARTRPDRCRVVGTPHGMRAHRRHTTTRDRLCRTLADPATATFSAR